jgi:hypothetical protein
MLLRTRYELRAREYATGEIGLQHAVDNCQQLAEALGLVMSIGKDAAPAIMVDVFGAANDHRIRAPRKADRSRPAQTLRSI